MDGKLDVKDFKIFILIGVFILFVISGVFISAKISEKSYEKLEIYRKSTKIKNDKDLFDYAIDTEQGNIMTETTIKADEPQKLPEMDKKTNVEFITLSRDEYRETYDMKTKKVTTVDSKGKSHTRTEIYYEWVWHHVGNQTLASSEILLYGNQYQTGLFDFRRQQLNASQFISKASGVDYYTESHHRFDYYAVVSGDYTILAKATDGTIKPVTGKVIETYDDDLNSVLDSKEKEPKRRLLIFLVVWTIVTIGASFICYLLLYRR